MSEPEADRARILIETPPPAKQRPKQPTRQLLDLRDELLLKVFVHLPFAERLALAGVCRRLRSLSAAPSRLWRHVDADVRVAASKGASTEELSQTLKLQLLCLHRWLAPRAAAIEGLSFSAPHGGALTKQTVLSLGGILNPLSSSAALTRVRIRWDGNWSMLVRCLGPFCPAQFPALRCLVLEGCQVAVLLRQGPAWRLLPALEELTVVDGRLRGQQSAGVDGLDTAWLPPTLTALRLTACMPGIATLPGVVAHLPRLRCLSIDEGFSTAFRGRLTALGPLVALSGRLQELRLSCCSDVVQRGIPTQLSCLTALRVLCLDAMFTFRSPTDREWDVLRPLKSLQCLSLKWDGLQAFPPAVAAMTHLQCLDFTNNQCPLPAGSPVMACLRELVVDWSAAFDGAAALRGATRLTRLVLALDPVVHMVDDGWNGEPADAAGAAAAAEGLLAALAAMPALRRVDHFIQEGEGAGVMAAVAPRMLRVMWQLGRRCPHVALGTLPSPDAVGWTTDAQLAGMERHRGMTLLPPVEQAPCC